jgi:hypothetical protein
MGQAAYAAHILATLSPVGPKINTAQLRAEAKIKLTIEEPPKKPRGGYPRWQRDGLIFEAISWPVARQTHPDGLLKAPHVSATIQGLDGLMIELNAGKTGIARTTIFEDKCTDDPRNTFLGKVLPDSKNVTTTSEAQKSFRLLSLSFRRLDWMMSRRQSLQQR